MLDTYLLGLFTRIFAWYHLLLIISAVILNPLVFYVCLRSRRLRSTSTFKLLAICSINDLLSCLEWNQADFVNPIFNLNLSTASLLYCRWVTFFLQHVTLEYASWMLVLISADRFFSMALKKWSKKYFNGPKPYLFALLLALIIILINLNELFTIGYASKSNGTEVVVCSRNEGNSFPWNNFMNQVFVYFGYIVPFVFLITFNSLIIYKAYQFSKAQRATAALRTTITLNGIKRKAQMTRTILIITFLYVTASIPNIALSGFLYRSLLTYDFGHLVLILGNGLQFSYPAFNFFILLYSNKVFAQEVKNLIRNIRQNRVFSMASRTRTNPTSD